MYDTLSTRVYLTLSTVDVRRVVQCMSVCRVGVVSVLTYWSRRLPFDSMSVHLSGRFPTGQVSWSGYGLVPRYGLVGLGSHTRTSVV